MWSTFVIFSIIIGAAYAQSAFPEYNDTICLGQEEYTVFGIENECYAYYYCYEEVGYLDDCENMCAGCQFDFEINDCNDANIVGCIPAGEVQTDPPVTSPPQTQAPITTQSPQTQPPGGTPDIECPPNEIKFFASANCSEYYVCAMGRALTMQCLEGLVWDDEMQRCDHPIYNPRCSGIDRDNNRNIKCNRNGFYPAAYPWDCEKFVFCAEGVPMLQQCPVGTAFHQDRCIERRYAFCQDTAKTY